MTFFLKISAILGMGVLLCAACAKETATTQPLQPSLSIADATVQEGEASGIISFKVRLSEASQNDVRVDFATLDSTANTGSDYVGRPDGQLIFWAGELEKNIMIEIKGDDMKEPNEVFLVILLDPMNATLARGRAIGTILNDDEVDYPFNIPTVGYSTPETYPGKTLVWRDEFNDMALNLNDWTFELGASGWGNNELQYYRPENAFLSRGNLIIEARKEGFEGANYTSSRLITKGKKEFTHGRIDIRAVLPEGQGIWPALWMLGGNISAVNWPACGEIDIMELVGHQPSRVHGTAHYGANTSSHQYKGNSVALPGTAKFIDEFHVFSIIWEQDKITWLLDDGVFYEITPALVSPAAYPFNQDFFFIFNIAVGGNWPGSPDVSTSFPQRMIVDYIRVFQ